MEHWNTNANKTHNIAVYRVFQSKIRLEQEFFKNANKPHNIAACRVFQNVPKCSKDFGTKQRFWNKTGCSDRCIVWTYNHKRGTTAAGLEHIRIYGAGRFIDGG